MSDVAFVPEAEPAAPIRLVNLVWVGLALAVMVAAIRSDVPWFLNFVHVMAGVLWTGIDLFMGFVIGPILRAASFPARRAIILRLMPRMLFIMPTLAVITGTAGWFHARQIGLLDIDYPQFGWVLAALVLVAVLTIEGVFILLPTNLIVYLEMRKPQPDRAWIGRMMRTYIACTALQGCLQVVMIGVMARFVTGL